MFFTEDIFFVLIERLIKMEDQKVERQVIIARVLFFFSTKVATKKVHLQIVL